LEDRPPRLEIPADMEPMLEGLRCVEKVFIDEAASVAILRFWSEVFEQLASLGAAADITALNLLWIQSS